VPIAALKKGILDIKHINEAVDSPNRIECKPNGIGRILTINATSIWINPMRTHSLSLGFPPMNCTAKNEHKTASGNDIVNMKKTDMYGSTVTSSLYSI